jgi:hypothetical protein
MEHQPVQQLEIPMGSVGILHIFRGPFGNNPEIANHHIAALGKVQLSPDIWIAKLPTDFAKVFIRACEPAHHQVDTDPWDMHLYGFFRRLQGETTLPAQAAIGELCATTALSRLIRPTTIGYRYCGEIIGPSLTNPGVRALTLTGENPDAYVANPAQDYLTPDDETDLRQLMSWVPSDRRMTPRLFRAFWYHERACRSYYLDEKIPIAVRGLESLLTVEKGRGITSRFAARAQQLASEVGVTLSRADFYTAYDLRSALAHGRSFLFDLHATLPASEHGPFYEKLETVLRSAVKQCLLDDSHYQRFVDDAAVKRFYPA